MEFVDANGNAVSQDCMSALFHNGNPKQHDAHIQFIGARRRCLFADSYGLGFQHPGFISPGCISD